MREPKTIQFEPVLGIISAIKFQKKDKLRASIYIEARFAFGVNIATIEHFRLRKGDEVDSILYEKITSFDQTISARRAAQKFLNTRRRTERDVRRKLQQNEIPDEFIDMIIDELKQAKLIDDAAYAQAFIHDRLLTKSVSKGKLALELQAKGIDRVMANEAVQGISSDDEEIDRALDAARKKLPGLERKESDHRRRSQKLYAFLAARGFTGSIIKNTLERLGQPAEEESYV
jgi:regulatory protein